LEICVYTLLDLMKKLFVFNHNLIILLMENVTVITTVIINS